MTREEDSARRLLNAVRQAVTGLLEPADVGRCIAAAKRELGDPGTFTEYAQFRAAAEIARLGLVFVHDRIGPGTENFTPLEYIEWTERLVDHPQTPLSDEYLLLAEAIEAGKRGDAAGAIAASEKAIRNDRVEVVLRLLGDREGDHPEIDDIAAVQLRCVSEFGRALRLEQPTAWSLRAVDDLVMVMDQFEAHAERMSGFALYRARLSVAYAQRDIAGNLFDAADRLARAIKNRPNDPRTNLTASLHLASLMRLRGLEDAGHGFYQLARSIDDLARDQQDECLMSLRSLGFARHAQSFEAFRDRFPLV